MTDAASPTVTVSVDLIRDLVVTMVELERYHGHLPNVVTEPNPGVLDAVKGVFRRFGNTALEDETKALKAEIARLTASNRYYEGVSACLRRYNDGLARIAEDRGTALTWLKGELAEANWHIERVTPYKVRMRRSSKHRDDEWYEGQRAFERSDPARVKVIWPVKPE